MAPSCSLGLGLAAGITGDMLGKAVPCRTCSQPWTQHPALSQPVSMVGGPAVRTAPPQHMTWFMVVSAVSWMESSDGEPRHTHAMLCKFGEQRSSLNILLLHALRALEGTAVPSAALGCYPCP